VSTLTVTTSGQTLANEAIVAAGTAGSVSVSVTNQTDLLIDINGYFVPSCPVCHMTYYNYTTSGIAGAVSARIGHW
jgi:hypothetical protein